MIKVTCENINSSNLMNLLVSINKSIAVNCLRAAGYELNDSDYVKRIHFTTQGDGTTNDKVINIILRANVNNTQAKSNDIQITSENYLKLVLSELGSITERKCLNEELAQNLADTSLKLSLIQIKTNQFVNSDNNPNFSSLVRTACKRAVFLQYNISRLAAIRNKYLSLVAEGKYPTMPPLEKLDFTCLKEPEEWCLLFNFLLEYPSLIESVAEELLNGKANSLQIFNFLSGLCSLYSTYYRRVRVLLEPKNHLLPLILTRLVLAEAIEQILENGLALLDIKKIEKM